VILQGDNLLLLPTLPAESVHTVVTSPPYFALRDYGVPPTDWPEVTYTPLAGLPYPLTIPAMSCPLGLEPTLEAFVGHLVLVFRQVRRVLRKDGTCWVNLGDGYAGSRSGPDTGSTLEGSRQNQNEAKHAKVVSRRRDDHEIPRSDLAQPGLKPKDLMAAPWRVALALQADGWYLRQDIIWHKPNPMPESTRDRCTKAHEYLFLLTKRKRYYYEAAAIREAVTGGANARVPGNRSHKGTQALLDGDDHHRTKGGLVAYAEKQRARQKVPGGWDLGPGAHGSFHREGRAGVNPKSAANAAGSRQNESFTAAVSADLVDERNKRSVWTVPTQPFPDAHFATFPEALIEPCILAGAPAGGTVLDLYGGSGTTGKVATRLGREFILMELKPEYASMATERVAGTTMGLAL
jgi:DNA modification methylase